MTLVYVDDRTTFVVEHDERYALGDPGAPLLTLNALDADGCVWAADVPDGWDFPEVELPIDRRQDGHGGYAGEPTYNPRTLTFEGSVAAPSRDGLRAAYRRLVAAVLGSVPSYVRYTHLDEPGAPGLWLLPTGKPKWRATDDRFAVWSFVMVAEDPIKTGTASTYGPVRLPSAAGEGGYPMGGTGAAMPWTAVTSSAITEQRRNLVPNPALTTATTSWFTNAGTGGTVATSRGTGDGPAGSAYLRATYSVANTSAAGTGSTASIVADGRAAAALPMPVTPGTAYSAAIQARSSVAQLLAAVLRWYDASGTAVGTAAQGTAAVAPAGTWTRYLVQNAVAPAGAAYARVEVVAVTGAGAVPFPIGGTFDATQAQLVVGTTVGTYFDGDTADTATVNYGWTGTVGASAAVEQVASYTTAAAAAGMSSTFVGNAGDEDAHAVYTVTGPVPQPQIRLGTGEYVSLTLDLAAGDSLVVDTAAGLVTVNGVNRYDAWGAGSVFPLIPPGGTEVRLRSATGGVNSTAGLLILTAPSWK